MTFEYDGQRWVICPTTQDHNSFFHATFGAQNIDDGRYTEKTARVRRMNWLSFLTFYGSRPRPAALREVLQNLFETHGWSIEHDKDFKEYQHYASQDRYILLDEIPVLASLANVRIVLFQKDRGTPRIIQPLPEMLGDYPLVSSNAMETVFVAFADASYSKLMPEDRLSAEEERVNNANIGRYERIYPGCGILHGVWYVMNMLTVVAINALKRCDTWRLSTDDARAGYFDDLILEFGENRSAVLVQAKVRARRRAVNINDLLSCNRKFSDFCLARCFFSHTKVKEHYNIANVALCTNVNIEFGMLESHTIGRGLNEADFLYFNGVTSICYSFENSVVPVFLQEFKRAASMFNTDESLVTEENIKDFVKDFQIVVSYPGRNDFEQIVEDSIVQMGLSGKYDVTSYARHLNKEIMKWYDGRAIYLTGSLFKAMFCDVRTEEFLRKLYNLGLELKPDKVRVNIMQKISHIEPANDYTLSLVKVAKFFEREGYNTLYLTTRESVYNQKITVEAFECPKYSYLVIYSVGQERDVEELCVGIVEILKRHQRKKVIVISDRQGEFVKLLKLQAPDMFQMVYDDVSFSDFTEDSQERMLEKAVMFYEASL